MKKILSFPVAAAVLIFMGMFSFHVFGQKDLPAGYILEREDDIAKEQPGPHNGGGITTASGFFSTVPSSKIVLTKRTLHPGSSIGYHLQQSNEVYYILSGTGEMKMNGQVFPVKAGDAILTLPGSSHGLTPTGAEDLTLIINYAKS